jgi:hypothetical protein
MLRIAAAWLLAAVLVLSSSYIPFRVVEVVGCHEGVRSEVQFENRSGGDKEASKEFIQNTSLEDVLQWMRKDERRRMKQKWKMCSLR